MSDGELGYRLGYAAFPIVFVAIAVFIGWRMGRKREPKKFVLWPVAVAGFLLALGALGTQLRKQVEAAPTSEAR
ncbi:MAG TPA: hypothetical protein VEC11_04300 [Allosphingosinicella sp.]|nr:hypothetical protein [Allosphingosinicella sp.]